MMSRTTPLLFSTPMIQALLEGKKTQTRRKIRGIEPNAVFFDDHLIVKHTKDGKLKSSIWYARFLVNGGQERKLIRYPNRPGDIIWVRESFTESWEGARQRGAGKYLFKDQVEPFGLDMNGTAWTPSIHMPKPAARIWLECTGIRPERIQKISAKDCKAEGVYYDQPTGMWVASEMSDGDTPEEAFRYLWYEVNDVKSWLENPWVWVRTFKIISTTGKPNTTNE